MTGKPPPQGGIDGPDLTPWEREARDREEARAERERLFRERINRQNKEHARRLQADNAEQAALLAAIINGNISPHEIDARTLQGDRAKDTLLVAKRLWDVCFQFKLDSRAQTALDFLDEVVQDTGADLKVRVDAAKTIVGARIKMANKVNNPGEAAVGALLAGMMQKGTKADLRSLTDEELREKFRLLLESTTNMG